MSSLSQPYSRYAWSADPTRLKRSPYSEQRNLRRQIILHHIPTMVSRLLTIKEAMSSPDKGLPRLLVSTIPATSLRIPRVSTRKLSPFPAPCLGCAQNSDFIFRLKR